MRMMKAQARLIEWERVARVATAGAGMPHLVPVCHVLVGGKIYFGSGKRGRKVRNVRANPRLALTVDHYSDDWSHLTGVMVQGTARVIEGVFLYNFGDAQRQAASQGPVAAPPWTYDVFVEAENNLWYRPSDANIEGKLEDFEVIQRLDRFQMLGQVEALRGRYYFLGSQFTVDEGLLFFDNTEPNNPTVDATLTTEKPSPKPTPG